MKLTDLNPRWVGAGGSGLTNGQGEPIPKRTGVGVSFDCPCGCPNRCFVGFSNPLDGGPRFDDNGVWWTRSGDTFETLTISPSIQRVGGCEWHGYVTNGEAVPA